MIEELYGKQTARDFRDGFDAMEKQLEGGDTNVTKAFSDTIIKFVWDTAKSFAFDLIKSRMGF